MDVAAPLLERFQAFAAGEPLSLPGHGQTPERHRRLADCAREDLSLARLVEGHSDALAILAEAGAPVREGALYAVWASDGPASQLNAQPCGPDGWRLDGVKQYCSGSSLVTAALVTAHFGSEVLLFDVPLGVAGVSVQPSNWTSPALADTMTAPVRFSDVRSAFLVGPTDFYLQRPGFWHGALGPAACWAGGALSLIDAATASARRDAHAEAHAGALLAAAWSFNAWLEQAGREIDADPLDRAHQAQTRALKVRHLIERLCTEVIDRFGRATGPGLLAFTPQVGRQHHSLQLYLRQCHAERDLEVIGRQERPPRA